MKTKSKTVESSPEQEGEDGDQPLKSKGIGKKHKSVGRKKRPATAAVSHEPTGDMMKQFKKTQYLGKNEYMGNEEEDAPDVVKKVPKRKRPSSSYRSDGLSKLQSLEYREQRRQENLVHTSSLEDQKKQYIMKKIFTDNLKAERIKQLKEGSIV